MAMRSAYFAGLALALATPTAWADHHEGHEGDHTNDAVHDEVKLSDSAQGAEEDTNEVATRSRSSLVRDTRAVTIVDSDKLAITSPRTVADALDALVGMSVQREYYAGSSPYVRGFTGQRVLTMIDGFRLSHSMMRPGANQYMNTIDPLLLDRIEVLRGPGSVLYGTDALAGVISLQTRNPREPNAAASGYLRGATVDRSVAGRAELDMTFGPVQVLGGVTGSTYGNLRGGGRPDGTSVPQYDGDEQLFTGYDQINADLKATMVVGETGRLTSAAIFGRQVDAPVAAQCTRFPYDCVTYSEQYFDMGYLKYEADYGFIEDLSLGLAVTHTRERRLDARSAGFSRDELDDMVGFQLNGRAATPTLNHGIITARLNYGFDGYLDHVGTSNAVFQDSGTGDRFLLDRGRLLEGSDYMSIGGFGLAELLVGARLGLTAGFRVAGYRADVEANPEQGGRAAYDRNFFEPAFSAGARVGIFQWLSFVANVDQGFRAPNLMDLSGRTNQPRGFILGNRDLDTERSWTFDAGVKVEHDRIRANVFGYASLVDDYISFQNDTCPIQLSGECGSAANVYQLANFDSARLYGIEADAEVFAPFGPWLASAFGSLTYTHGETDGVGGTDDQPVAMIPPVSGRVGLRVRTQYAFGELVARYGFEQDRLAPIDLTDPRIPAGGTNGYFVPDLRIGAHVSDRMRATLTFHNLTNESYRIHGSGIDSPGFGVVASLAGTLPAP